MLVSLILISVIIVAVAFVVNQNNAKRLLNGYNNLSAEQQAKVDIKPYLHFYKQFHLFLGISLFIIGLGLYLLHYNTALGTFIAVYPIIAYVYFAWRTAQFYKRNLCTASSSVLSYVAVGILLLTAVGVAALLYVGTKDSKMQIFDNQIVISGMYGESIAYADMQAIVLVDSLPTIVSRNNGFSLGNSHKGYYRTKDGTKVKLFLNTKEPPFILLQRESQPWVYFSQDAQATPKLFMRLQSAFHK